MPEETMKEDYIAKCVALGKSKEECEQAWNQQDSANAKAKDHATLFGELEMEKTKNAQLTKMLKEATDIIKAVNEERDAITEARKYEIAVEIERDSDGKLKHTDLMGKSLRDLTTMKTAIDSARPRDFVSTAALLNEHDSAKEPKLTVGEWDPVAKKWKGGIQT